VKSGAVLKTAMVALLGGVVFSGPAKAQDVCTFEDWAWHSEEARAKTYKTVRSTRDRLTPAQHHPTLPCSICREDQTDVRLSNGAKVTVCKFIASDIHGALEEAIEAGFPIETLKGYRVGRTRGPLDDRGLRTVYSNHSYGLAVDVNSEANGLYDRCVSWSPKCRLRHGGEWDPDNPLSVTRGSVLYDALTNRGFHWGGELAGRQKDFMHFSLTGD